MRSARTSIQLLLPCLLWGCLALAQAEDGARDPSAAKKRSNSKAPTKTVTAPAETKNVTIEKILIKGNRKIEADAIRNKLVSREGAPFSEETVRQDLQELFNLGYFYNVEVDRTEGGRTTLTYTVTE